MAYEPMQPRDERFTEDEEAELAEINAAYTAAYKEWVASTGMSEEEIEAQAERDYAAQLEEEEANWQAMRAECGGVSDDELIAILDVEIRARLGGYD